MNVERESHENSQFVAEVGKRIELDVTLEWAFQFEGNWGTTTLYKFTDAEGNVIVWWASKPFCPGPVNPDHHIVNEEIEVGQRVRVKGTVKKHEEREGIKQTTLSRVAEALSKTEKKERKEEYVRQAREYYARLGYCERCYGGMVNSAPACQGCYACEGTGRKNFGTDYSMGQYAKPGAYMAFPQSETGDRLKFAGQP